MLVSVIIPCYNAERWIRETLMSVMVQNISDMEVIVVDDGSTDSSAEIIKEEFSWVKLIQTENRGPSHARNTGTVAANGKYLQYLDADDLLAPGKLAVQIQRLETTSGDVAYGDWQDLWPRSDGSFAPGQVNPFKLEQPYDIIFFTAAMWWPLAALLFRHAMIEKIGKWNVSLPIVQDTRLFFDCASHGAKFVYCPQLMAQYRRHQSGSQFTSNPIGLSRDKLRNAKEVEEWWVRNGGLTEARKQALLTVYFQISRASSEIDPESFEIACTYLKRFSANSRYIPSRPIHLAATSRLIGYRNAERLAVLYRRVKRFMGSIVRNIWRVRSSQRRYGG